MSRTALLLVAITLGAGVVAWRVAGSDSAERGAREAPAEPVAADSPAVLERARLAAAPETLAPVDAEVSAGERVALGPGKTRLVARVVDADGVAIPQRSVGIGFEPEEERTVDSGASELEIMDALDALTFRSTRTGDSELTELRGLLDERSKRDAARHVTARQGGRVEIDVPERLIGVTGRVLHLRDVPDAYGNRVSLDVPLPDALTPGTHDLGELRLPPAPLLVGGFVVDGRGTAVLGAIVEIGVGRREPTSIEKRRTLADGSFRLTGDVDGVLSVWLGARLTSASSGARIPVAVGANDVVLTLRQAGTLRGRILQPATEAPLNLHVVAWPMVPPGNSVEITPSRSGELLAYDLVPGDYTVLVSLGADSAPLFKLERVLIHERETTRPAALDPLDLRGILREVQVRITAPDRRAVAAQVSYRATGDTDAPWNTIKILARGSLLTTAPALDLRVEAFGYRSVEVADVAVRAEIALEPAFRLTFLLDKTAEEHRVYVLEVLDPTTGAELARAELKAERKVKRPRASVSVLTAGPVLVRLTVRESSRNAWDSSTTYVVRSRSPGALPVRELEPPWLGEVLDVVDRSFDVLDRTEEQTFLLRIPPSDAER